MLTKKIGFLGGGQLGKMLCESGQQWHLNTYVLDKKNNMPASVSARHFVEGDFNNYSDVVDFGRNLDVLSIEIEKVNTDALKKLQEEGKEVYPQPQVVEIIRDKKLQKDFYSQSGIKTSAYSAFTSAEDIKSAVHNGSISPPFVQKARTGGYDGKGVSVIKGVDDLNMLLPVPSIVEALVNIEKELSVIVCRNKKGQVISYPIVEMTFNQDGNLVDEVISPAKISESHSAKAKEIAKNVIEKLDMVGLLAVEMFLSTDGEILVNECAPRPHNSGHLTMHNCACSQFEQLLRCLLDLPLIEIKNDLPATMINIIGPPEGFGRPKFVGLDKIIAMEGVHVYLYGKEEGRPYRKLGHITVVNDNEAELRSTVNFVKNNFRVEYE